jgi:hypothetical protein
VISLKAGEILPSGLNQPLIEAGGADRLKALTREQQQQQRDRKTVHAQMDWSHGVNSCPAE